MPSVEIKNGDWVRVTEAADIPVLFRPNGPTRGRVETIDDAGLIEVWVPIDGADVDEHSQSVWYEPSELMVERHA